MRSPCLQYKMHINKMADHRKSCLRPKLSWIWVVSVANGYAAAIQMPVSIVDQRRWPVSPVCMVTDRQTDRRDHITSCKIVWGNNWVLVLICYSRHTETPSQTHNTTHTRTNTLTSTTHEHNTQALSHTHKHHTLAKTYGVLVVWAQSTRSKSQWLWDVPSSSPGHCSCFQWQHPLTTNTACWTDNLITDGFNVCVFMCVYVVCTACGHLEE